MLTVRRVGHLTTALFALAPGARVGLRGPFGRGFPDDAPGTPDGVRGRRLRPRRRSRPRSTCSSPSARRARPVAIVYGAREPATRIHRAALAAWAALPDVHLVECVEHPDRCLARRDRRGSGLRCRRGRQRSGRTRACICGPAAMMGASARQLASAGLAPEAIHLALERRMHCGVGECGHCYVNHRYVCTDGPVFTLAELRGLTDARLESGLAA